MIEFPSLYKVSDSASINAQDKFLKFIKFELILMIIAAGISLIRFENRSATVILYIVTSFLLFCSILLTFFLKVKKFEKIWYGSRAVAESVKTLSWKFMTGAEPFQISNPESQKIFLARLGETLKEKRELAINYQVDMSSQIPNSLVELRQKPLAERKDFYIKERLQNQREWYQKKANDNQEKEEFYFWISLSMQIIGFVCSLILIACPEMINLIGLFTTLAAAFLSWMQLKKFQELAQSYAFTAQELSLVESSLKVNYAENDFSIFVSDAETAISREHTMWVARRDA